ncbi:MAG: GNAT family N-acetyltransferase [Paracoccaceae bacterium]
MSVTIPVLETERLILRSPRSSDYEAYADFCASPRSVGVGGPYTRSQSFSRLSAIIGHWHLRGYGRWMVSDKSDGRPLGVVGLYFPEGWPEPEIAWSLFEAAEGKGIALEAALASRAYAYDVLGWTTVISCAMPENTRSVALAKRMGAKEDTPFIHNEFGELKVWRHLSPDQIENGGMEAYA